MDRTEWFPYTINPVRVGWYECSDPVCDMHYWNGKLWFRNLRNYRNSSPIYMGDSYHLWRGLLKETP